MMAGLLWNEWAFFMLTSLIMILCLREYFKLIFKIFPEVYADKWLPAAFMLISILMFSSLFLFLFGEGSVVLQKLFFITALILLSASLLKSMLQKNTALHSFLLGSGALFYISVTCGMFLYLRAVSLCIPLALILMIWMNDTMAYLVGSFIGKTPFSKISPKKTWEGTGGGVLLTLVGAAVWGYYSPYYKMMDWMALALCASIAGTLGDLFESKLKRMADVKDSGTMMPGHGGALDRFDSLLLATPFAFAYALVFMAPLPLHLF